MDTSMWFVFVLGFAAGLVIGNKTLRDKLGQLLRKATSGKGKDEPPQTEFQITPRMRIRKALLNGGRMTAQAIADGTRLNVSDVLYELFEGEREREFRRVNRRLWELA